MTSPFDPPEWQLSLERAAANQDWSALVAEALTLPVVPLWSYLDDPVAPTQAWSHRILEACGYRALERSFQEQVNLGHMPCCPASPQARVWAETQAAQTTPLAATVMLSRHLACASSLLADQEPVIRPFLACLTSRDRADFMMQPYLHPSDVSQPMFERIMKTLTPEDQQRWAPNLLVQSVYLGNEAQTIWAQAMAEQAGVMLSEQDWTKTLWMTVVHDRDDLATLLSRQHPEAVPALIRQIMKNDDADVVLADRFLAQWLPTEQLEATCVSLEEGGLMVNDRLPQTQQKRLAQQRWQSSASKLPLEHVPRRRMRS